MEKVIFREQSVFLIIFINEINYLQGILSPYPFQVHNTTFHTILGLLSHTYYVNVRKNECQKGNIYI